MACLRVCTGLSRSPGVLYFTAETCKTVCTLCKLLRIESQQSREPEMGQYPQASVIDRLLMDEWSKPYKSRLCHVGDNRSDVDLYQVQHVCQQLCDPSQANNLSNSSCPLSCIFCACKACWHYERLDSAQRAARPMGSSPGSAPQSGNLSSPCPYHLFGQHHLIS